MTSMQRTAIQRLEELLAGEASADLDHDERAELAGTGDAAEDRLEFLRIAALAQATLLSRDEKGPRRLPTAMRDRLSSLGSSWSQGAVVGTSARTDAVPRPMASVSSIAAVRDRNSRRPSTQAAASRRTGSGRTGWYVAAGLSIALAAALFNAPLVTPSADPAADRGDLLAASGTLRVPWSPAASGSGYREVTGDVVWNNARQEGYLRISGLPVNDRTRAQYQLWIVAPERDRHPVDGGVFDVSSTGELIIPIHARLPVSRPEAFAITLEKPGGVVVSSEPLLVVAPVG